MPSLSPEQCSELKSLIDKHGLGRFSDHIERMAQSAVQLLPVQPDDYSQLGVTRFGGVPDLPPEIEWPSAAGVYMTFVAQINLAEMPTLKDSPLPRSGWLYFFLVEGESADELTHKVIHFPGHITSLKKVEPPAPQAPIESVWNESEQYVPYRMDARQVISIPPSMVGFVKKDEVVDDLEADNYYALVEDLHGQPISRTGASQLLGWHEDIGDNPTQKAVFRKHNLWNIRYAYSLQSIENKLNDAVHSNNTPLADIYKKEKADFERYLANKESLDAEMSEWKLLLELDSHYDIGMCWWDAGKVQFMIHDDDLANLIFDNTFAQILTS
jgi:uncharacterized protein YwqG